MEPSVRDPSTIEDAGVLKGPVTSRTATSEPTTSALTAVEPNAIVLENQKLGNPQSEWDIVGAGSSNIEGFATDISINRGNRVDFKINTNSSNYRIDIYRLGYYGGMGARRVHTIQHTTGAQIQPAPLRDSTTGLVDAGNWSISDSWDIPTDAVSGIYIAKLVRQDGTFGQNHIPFIVRDDSSKSDIAFQTADTTWQAYNPWGGVNLYGGNGPATGSSPGRAYKVSYNRPFTTRGGGLAAGPQDWIFGAEFPALMWLEKNGYDVSYMSGVDVDRFGGLLKNHKMYLSVGHDEYWSGQQRANVEAARDAGVNLAFWSGNEVYWKTRWEPSISAGGQGYRTLVSYKETRAGPIDPSNEWTGTWRDPRFIGPGSQGAGNPENSLTGTMFTVDAYRSDAITIPYGYADQRFWRHTSVANLQPGQTATLTQNYLGYEWDSAVDNGFAPAGLVKLSSTTLPVSQYLLDYGTRTGSATATHNLTLYRASSGALVFGAGTVYWSWGLDANHDLNATPVDPRVKQAMVNLLADMGIQPGTLEPGLMAATQSTDFTPPTSTITTPGGGTELRVGQAVTITGTALDSGGGVVAGIEITTNNGATWHPVTGDETWSYSWVPHTAGTFTIKTRAVDDSINLESPGTGRTVTVTGNNLFSASATPPRAADMDPSAIEVGMRFQSSVAGTVTGVRFYKSELNIGTHTGSLWSSTGQRLATATFTNETGVGWQAVSFTNPITITPNTPYTVSYHTDYGYYSTTTNGFASSVTNGPLTAPVGAGVYRYGASAFPTSVFQNENYWVDVLFAPSTPAANRNPVAANDTGFATSSNTALTLAAGQLLGNDSDADGDPLSITGVSNPTNGTVTYSAQNNTVIFTPASNFTGPAGFTYAISDGRGGTASANVSLNVNAPAANRNPVANDDTGFATTANTAISIAMATLLGNDSDPDGDPLSITAVGNSTNGTVAISGPNIVFTPTSNYTGPASFSYTVSDGRGGTDPANVSLSVNAPSSGSVSLFSASATPATLSDPDRSSVELGMKFQANTSGTITGIRFYKGANDTGTHTGTLWTAAGAQMGTLTFQNESASGWQSATFTNPISINANTTYVVSYHSNGGYALNTNYFGSAVTNGPLTGLASSASGGNGVYAYGTASVFPNSTYRASNYWVDVLFAPSTPAANRNPVAANDTGFATSSNTALTLAAGQLLGNDSDADGDPLSITGVSNPTNGTVTYSAQNNTVIFTPASNFTGPAGFTYAISDGRGGTASANVSLNVNAPAANRNPVANDDTGFATTANTAISIAMATLLGNDSDPDGDPLSITAVGNSTNGTVAISGPNIVFTPTSNYTGPASFSYTVSDGRGGTDPANVSLSVNAPSSGSVSLFSASATPATLSDPDRSSVELGMKFQANTSGTITGIRFYKGANDTGTHTGTLWTAAGAQMGTLTFQNESASGWQSATFTNPISINANTTYVVSYHSNGGYALNTNYFGSAVTNGPLTGLASSASGGNGVYAYGNSSLFPTSSYQRSNYWVDVLFNPSTSAAA